MKGINVYVGNKKIDSEYKSILFFAFLAENRLKAVAAMAKDVAIIKESIEVELAEGLIRIQDEASENLDTACLGWPLRPRTSYNLR